MQLVKLIQAHMRMFFDLITCLSGQLVLHVPLLLWEVWEEVEVT